MFKFLKNPFSMFAFGFIGTYFPLHNIIIKPLSQEVKEMQNILHMTTYVNTFEMQEIIDTLGENDSQTDL